jgi:serpin B
MAESYDGAIETVDYKDGDAAASRINKWVEEQTQGRIKDIVSGLDSLIRLILVNAIYFKGMWKSPFDPAATKEADFHVTQRSSSKAKFMYKMMKKLPYFEDDRLQAVELQYIGNDLSMIVALPTGYDKLEFDPQELVSKMFPSEVQVYLPKFRTECSFSLSGTLQDMGVIDAFDDRNADFSGISSNNDLYISAVLHKAFVEVNEEGTEAAAATAVVLSLRSMEMPRPPKTFRCDRPFYWAIIDRKDRSVLFSGKISDPAA